MQHPPPGVSKKAIMDHLRHRLPFGMPDRKRIDHMDEMMRRHKGKGVMKKPKDILKDVNLRPFGIMKNVDDSTTDKEKRADLEKLEEAELQRHPYMMLLTNPGEMGEIECLSVEFVVVFQVTGCHVLWRLKLV